MTDPITRSEVLAAQALATDAPGPACDAVRSLAATLLEFAEALKIYADPANFIEGNDWVWVGDDDPKRRAAELLRKFEGGE